jgi:peroxiredoxin
MTTLRCTLTLGAALLALATACRTAEEPVQDGEPVASAKSADEGGTKSLSKDTAATARGKTAPSQATAADSASAAAEAEKATDFTLTDTFGNEHHLHDLLADGKTVVLEWFNPDCPVSRAYHHGDRDMASVYAQVKGPDLVWLAINSGAEGKQGAGLERNQRAVREYQIPYPVLMDPTGKVGKAYGAATTPHMFVIAPDGSILYDGAIDDSAGRGEASKNYVVLAVKEHSAGRAITTPRTRPFGCGVKYAN